MMKGHCECRTVRFTIDGDIEDYSHCHCSQCRRLHGAAYATFAGVKLDGFRYTDGEDQVSEYASSDKNDRWFCAVCGSNIACFARDEPDMLYVAMSAIEGHPALPEVYHIFVGSKAPWHEITDDAPQYETAPSD